MSDDALVPFVLDVPGEQLDDLRDRLRRVRLPEPATDPAQGIALPLLTELLEQWATTYDWRRLETELNGLGQWRTEIDGLGIHFLHVRSPRADARPLVITHGWPGSVVEFLDVIGPLTDPGDDAVPAFHVVAPSLPGYGFSDKPTGPGWDTGRIADAWAELMGRLGYDRFLAQGGDWGAMVTSQLGARHPDRVAGLHTTMPVVARPRDADLVAVTATERRWLAETDEFRRVGGGYSAQQSTRPQTLGYALVDSPAGQLAWIAEKFLGWTDGDGFGSVTRERLLDDVAVYWLTASGASSARLYWESFANRELAEVGVPSAVSYFPAEMMKFPRAWVERRYTDLRYWNELDRGGHFASLEVPEVFVAELRAAFTAVV